MKGAATDYIFRLEEESKSSSEALNEAKLETEKEKEKSREFIPRDNLLAEENEILKQTIKETVSYIFDFLYFVYLEISLIYLYFVYLLIDVGRRYTTVTEPGGRRVF